MTELIPIQNLPVTLQRHPFSNQFDTFFVEGKTVGEIIEALKVPPFVMGQMHVWIDDAFIPREDWYRCVPIEGEVVHLKVLPAGGGGGGGKDVLRVVAMVAIAIVAVAAGQAYAASMMADAAVAGEVVGTTMGISNAAWAGAAVSVGVNLVGNLALNALIPPPGLNSFDSGSSSQKYTLTGVQNQFDPYGPIPRLIGKTRMYPVLAGRPYTEIKGNDEYMRIALVVGLGPCAISDIKIGETPITAYQEAEYEIREGWASDSDLTLYTNTIVEDRFSSALDTTVVNSTSVVHHEASSDGDGNYYAAWDETVNSTSTQGTWVVKTTQLNTNEATVDITFPSGLVHYDNGNRTSRTVEFSAQYAPAGSSSWTDITWDNSADEQFKTAGKITVTGSDSSAVRISGRVKFGSTGQWQIRIRRNTDKGDSQTVDTALWTALRSIKPSYPIAMKGLALIAIRIKATGQLNGVPNSINCIAQSYLPVNTSGSWSYQLSSNPAWGIADLIRRRMDGTTVSDSLIDLDAFRSFATACDALKNGEHTWEFNGVLDGGSIFDNVRKVASSSRALYTIKDGKHSIVRDIQQTVPIQHITPRNSFKYSGQKVFTDLPHALRVTFTNKDIGYKQDERIVYYDGYSSSNATKFEVLDLPGCTSANQAYREARYHMAVAKLRPEIHKVSMDIENLRCSIGDLVYFAHDAISIGVQQSRVKAIGQSGGFITSITLYDEAYVEAGTTYGIRARLATGSSVVMTCAAMSTGYTAVLLFTGIVPVGSGPQVDDLVMFGIAGTESAPMMVTKIEPGPDLTASITMVDAQDVYSSDTGTIPTFNSYITYVAQPTEIGVSAAAPSVPSLYSVKSDESTMLMGNDGAITYRMFVTIEPPSTGITNIQFFELQYKEYKEINWHSVMVKSSSPQYILENVAVNTTYMLRVRSINSVSGAPSAWSALKTITPSGKSTAIAAPSNLAGTGQYKQISLTWTNPSAKDYAQTVIYRATTNNLNNAIEVWRGNATSKVFTDVDGTYYFWAKAIDTSGLLSASNTAYNAGTRVDTVSATSLGLAGRTVSLTTSNGAITYDTAGNNPSPASITVTATSSNTMGTPFYEFIVEGVSKQNSTSNTYTYTAPSAASTLPDVILVKLREDATNSMVFATDSITVIGLVPGASAVQVYVSNPAHTCFKSADNIVTYTGSGTTIRVAEGTTFLTEDSSAPYSNGTFRVTATATNITTGSASGQGTSTLTFADHSGMTGTQAKIEYAVTVKNAAGVESTFYVYQNFGQSSAGANGINGQRGSQTFYVATSNSAWSDSLANATVPLASRVLNDVVTQYKTGTWATTKFWDGTNWSEVTQAIDGNLLVSGTIGASKMAANLMQSDNVLTRGLTVRDANGNVILASGIPLSSTNITPDSGWLNSNVTPSGIGVHTFRVISQGAAAGAPATVGVHKDGVLANNTANRSYMVGKVARSDGAFTFVGSYDVFGNSAEANNMAAALNALDPSVVVLIWTWDEPRDNRTYGNLPAAMYRCGASPAIWGSANFRYRSAYVLVGIPGIGQGNGAEAYSGTIDTDPNAWCDVGFSLINGIVTGVSGTYKPNALSDYGYTGALDANKTYVDGSGRLYGVSSGGGTYVNNGLISIGNDGTLYGANGGKVTIDGLGYTGDLNATYGAAWNTNVSGQPKIYRVVARGLSCTTSPASAGLYDEAGTQLFGETTIYNVVKINRSTRVVSSVGSWYVLGSSTNATAMANALAAIGSDHIVVIYTYDEPQGTRLQTDLATQMYRCGASRAVYGSQSFQYRSAYILIGIPGCGEGNGFEAYQGTVSDDTNAWCDVTFMVAANGSFIVSGAAFTPRTLFDYGYTGALDANKTYVDSNGQIQGVSSGAGTAVANSLISYAGLGGKALGLIDKITPNNITTYIDGASIGSAQIANTIQSDNYAAGATGWAITKNGNGLMEINNIIARGTVYATAGEISGDFKVGGKLTSGIATHMYGRAYIGASYYAGYSYVYTNPTSWYVEAYSAPLVAGGLYVIAEFQPYMIGLNYRAYGSGPAYVVGALQVNTDSGWVTVCAWGDPFWTSGVPNEEAVFNKVPTSFTSRTSGFGLNGPIKLSSTDPRVRVQAVLCDTLPSPLEGTWSKFLRNAQAISMPASFGGTMYSYGLAGATATWDNFWRAGAAFHALLIRVDSNPLTATGWSWGETSIGQ